MGCVTQGEGAEAPLWRPATVRATGDRPIARCGGSGAPFQSETQDSARTVCQWGIGFTPKQTLTRDSAGEEGTGITQVHGDQGGESVQPPVQDAASGYT